MSFISSMTCYSDLLAVDSKTGEGGERVDVELGALDVPDTPLTPLASSTSITSQEAEATPIN